jgi:hypothetical protein
MTAKFTSVKFNTCVQPLTFGTWRMAKLKSQCLAHRETATTTSQQSDMNHELCTKISVWPGADTVFNTCQIKNKGKLHDVELGNMLNTKVKDPQRVFLICEFYH